MTSAKSRQTAAPSRPRLTLRVAFAGNRQLPRGGVSFQLLLEQIVQRVSERLLKHGQAVVDLDSAFPLRRFYADEAPCLRLITGLAEGADALAGEVLLGSMIEGVDLRLAAVLPGSIESYRSSRAKDFLPEFDRQLAACEYVLCGDGRYERAAEDAAPETKAFADLCRARGYRLQSRLLLRQADMLLAVFDPLAKGAIGGTAETVEAALAFELPVLVINPTNGAAALRLPSDGAPPNWAAILSNPLANDPIWERLNLTVDSLLGGPRADEGQIDAKVLEKFFAVDQAQSDWGRKFQARANKAWKRLQNRFELHLPGKPKLSTTAESEGQVCNWRERAKKLNYVYSDCYRGGFWMNIRRAFLAVLLATSALVVSLYAKGTWSYAILLGLAAAEFYVVYQMAQTIHRANSKRWSERAVDFRYLAERFRSLYFLPAVGSYQPVVSAHPHSDARLSRQGPADWFFNACLRSLSPAESAMEHYDVGNGKRVPIIRTNAEAALRAVGDDWLGCVADGATAGRGQIGYHEQNADRMHAMHHVLNNATKRLGHWVVWAVGADVVLLFGFLFHLWPDAIYNHVSIVKTSMVVVAVLIPAALAGLNGLRFQSECQRLHERSLVMMDMLQARRKQIEATLAELQVMRANPASDCGSATLEALQVVEAITDDMISEVTEWRMLYTKELPEV